MLFRRDSLLVSQASFSSSYVQVPAHAFHPVLHREQLILVPFCAQVAPNVVVVSSRPFHLFSSRFCCTHHLLLLRLSLLPPCLLLLCSLESQLLPSWPIHMHSKFMVKEVKSCPAAPVPCPNPVINLSLGISSPHDWRHRCIVFSSSSFPVPSLPVLPHRHALTPPWYPSSVVKVPPSSFFSFRSSSFLFFLLEFLARSSSRLSE